MSLPGNSHVRSLPWSIAFRTPSTRSIKLDIRLKDAVSYMDPDQDKATSPSSLMITP